MSFCRRFVTYLFQYDNQMKGRNCGFAKVDARQGRCRMEIQMKGCEDGNYAVYLLRQNEQELVGLPIGEVRVGNGAGKTVLLFPVKAIGGSRFGLEDMQGIYLTAGKKGFAASQWEDGEVEWGTFRIYEGRDYPEIPDAGAGGKAAHAGAGGEAADAGAGGKAADAEAEGEAAGAGAEEETADAGVEEVPAEAYAEKESAGDGICEGKGEASESKRMAKIADVDKRESAAQLEMQATQTAAAIDISPYMTAWEKRWQRFCTLHPLLFPFEEEKNIYAVKIDLRDFRSLPKPYWQLANNSFLLHGYFNYRYILLGCEDGEKKKWFVAVPGVFQNQEQLLAGLFGFGEFRTKHVTKQKTGEFGFWYRYLEM